MKIRSAIYEKGKFSSKKIENVKLDGKCRYFSWYRYTMKFYKINQK